MCEREEVKRNEKCWGNSRRVERGGGLKAFYFYLPESKLQTKCVNISQVFNFLSASLLRVKLNTLKHVFPHDGEIGDGNVWWTYPTLL